MVRVLIVTLLAGLVLSPVALAADMDGKKAFRKRCGTCHKIREVGEGLKGLTTAERTKHLDRFLSAHHAPDAAERAAIIDYMNRRLER